MPWSAGAFSVFSVFRGGIAGAEEVLEVAEGSGTVKGLCEMDVGNCKFKKLCVSEQESYHIRLTSLF